MRPSPDWRHARVGDIEALGTLCESDRSIAQLDAVMMGAGADRTARDQEHDSTPLGWAETAVKVTNNPACAAVVTFLARA